MTISTVNAVTKEFIEQLNANFEQMTAEIDAFVSFSTDVPAFSSQFFGVVPPPPLSRSAVGALPEVSGGNLMGLGNLGVGPGALGHMSNGAVNVAVGNNALGAAVHEAYSVAIGWGALALSEGYENVAVGYRVLGVGSNTGIQNTGIGATALYVNTTGSYNSGLGSHALVSNTTGYGNTASGYSAMFNNTTGIGNCAYGVASMYNNNADANCAFGYEALKDNVSGTQNTALGRSALRQGTGSANTAVGYLAGGSGLSLTANGLCLLGWAAGNVLTGDAHYNVLIGYTTGFAVTTGAGNVLVGGSPDGTARNQVTTGNGNVSLGYNVMVPSATADNQLVISNFIYGTGMSGSAASISPGKIGLGTKAPATELELVGAFTLSSFVAGIEISAPAAPAANGFRIFAQDNGGKTELMVIFGSGAAQQLAIEP